MKTIKCKYCGKKTKVDDNAVSGVCWRCCMNARKKKKRIKNQLKNYSYIIKTIME